MDGLDNVMKFSASLPSRRMNEGKISLMFKLDLMGCRDSLDHESQSV